MLKSLVEDALARDDAPMPRFEQAPAAQPAYKQAEDADAELIAILQTLRTNIKIMGVGGGGSNTINRIYDEQIVGAETYAANTDAQHLLMVRAQHKILLGRRSTRGLGAGALPQAGEQAAQEAEQEIRKAVQDANIVFVTAGMGGGTGTGAAAVVAGIAKDAGALTIAVTTTPFKGEGKMRMENAEWGLERLRNSADTVIVIPNDKLLELYPRLSLNQAFKVADEVLTRAIKGITELITKPGLVNLDFNDLRTIMKGGGVAMIGMGEGEGDEKVEDAVNEAINSPLIDVDITGANGVLVNVTGGEDMSIGDAQKVAEMIQAKVSPGARIIWGASVDPALDNSIRVMVVITGVKSKNILGPKESKSAKAMSVDFIK